eukprot:353654-Chlamydomonas_euryale.AAC.6
MSQSHNSESESELKGAYLRRVCLRPACAAPILMLLVCNRVWLSRLANPHAGLPWLHPSQFVRSSMAASQWLPWLHCSLCVSGTGVSRLERALEGAGADGCMHWCTMT